MTIKIVEKNMCTGCHSCSNACPRKCISMQFDNEGFLYPIIDASKCINCGMCESVCPIIYHRNPSNELKLTFAAYHNDEQLRLQSSSGGIFSAIVEQIIDMGGVVFGAAFDNKYNVVHTYVESKNELLKFRGSKYVQSKIGDSYQKAKMFLDSGRIVYFSGTPCQIAGLYSFLRKSYDNLITQDLICHGVPSPMVWLKYIEYREKMANSSIKNISFRSKISGWNNFSILFEFKNGTKYSSIISNGNSDDPFMKLFLKNYCLRPSCYDCQFKKIHRHADITLADFWGIQSVLPNFDDDKGVSAILIHSDKGKKAFELINDKITFKKTDFNKTYNWSYVNSSPLPTGRDKFMNSISKERFEDSYLKLMRFLKRNQIIKKMTPKNIWMSLKYRAKHAISKVSKKSNLII